MRRWAVAAISRVLYPRLPTVRQSGRWLFILVQCCHCDSSGTNQTAGNWKPEARKLFAYPSVQYPVSSNPEYGLAPGGVYHPGASLRRRLRQPLSSFQNIKTPADFSPFANLACAKRRRSSARIVSVALSLSSMLPSGRWALPTAYINALHCGARTFLCQNCPREARVQF